MCAMAELRSRAIAHPLIVQPTRDLWQQTRKTQAAASVHAGESAADDDLPVRLERDRLDRATDRSKCMDPEASLRVSGTRVDTGDLLTGTAPVYGREAAADQDPSTSVQGKCPHLIVGPAGHSQAANDHSVVLHFEDPLSRGIKRPTQEDLVRTFHDDGVNGPVRALPWIEQAEDSPIGIEQRNISAIDIRQKCKLPTDRHVGPAR